MSAGVTPIFPATLVLGFVQGTAANAGGRDGTGTIYDIFTGTTNGDRIDEVRAKFQVTTTAGMVRFYIKKSGGSYRLIHEEPVPAITVSATQPAFECVWPCQLQLLSGDILSASLENANACNFFCLGGSF